MCELLKRLGVQEEMVTWPSHLSILSHCHCGIPIRDRLELLRGHSADDIFNVAYRAFGIKGQIKRASTASTAPKAEQEQEQPVQLGSLVAFEPCSQKIKGTTKNGGSIHRPAPIVSWDGDTDWARPSFRSVLPTRELPRPVNSEVQSLNQSKGCQYVRSPQGNISPFFSRKTQQKEQKRATNRRNRYTPPGPLHNTKPKYRNTNAVVSRQPHLPVAPFSTSMPSLTPTYRDSKKDERSKSFVWSSNSNDFGEVHIHRIPGPSSAASRVAW
jgi:hypothetical protein